MAEGYIDPFRRVVEPTPMTVINLYTDANRQKATHPNGDAP